MNGFLHWWTTDRLIAGSSTVAALVAAAALIITMASGKRQQNALDKVAGAAADSATIARESSEYFKRMAESMEKSLEERDAAIAADARGHADAASLDDLVRFPRAAWEIRPLRGSLYELVNSGGASAYNVSVTCEGAVRFDGPDIPSEWTAGSGREFFAVGSMQTGIPVLRVEWTDTPVEDVNVRDWTRPIPPRS